MTAIVTPTEDTTTRPIAPELLQSLPVAQTLIAIATYNERQTLPSLVEVIRLILPQVGILIVDDASPDGTSDWCREWQTQDPRLFLLERPGKLGLGTALTTAMAYAVEHSYRYLITMDADHSHPVSLLPRLIAVAQGQDPDASTPSSPPPQSCPDVVIGSRYCRGGSIHGWPLRRYLMSRVINWYSRWWLRLPVQDCSGGYRCYRVDQLPPVLSRPLLSQGYSFEEEILWRLHNRGAKIAEIPICFINRLSGSSKLRLGGIMAAMRVLFRLTWSEWFGGGFRPAEPRSENERSDSAG